MVNKAVGEIPRQFESDLKLLCNSKIAEEQCVSDNVIRKWCIKYNLPSRKKDINSYSDEKWELI